MPGGGVTGARLAAAATNAASGRMRNGGACSRAATPAARCPMRPSGLGWDDAPCLVGRLNGATCPSETGRLCHRVRVKAAIATSWPTRLIGAISYQPLIAQNPSLAWAIPGYWHERANFLRKSLDSRLKDVLRFRDKAFLITGK